MNRVKMAHQVHLQGKGLEVGIAGKVLIRTPVKDQTPFRPHLKREDLGHGFEVVSLWDADFRGDRFPVPGRNANLRLPGWPSLFYLSAGLLPAGRSPPKGRSGFPGNRPLPLFFLGGWFLRPPTLRAGRPDFPPGQPGVWSPGRPLLLNDWAGCRVPIQGGFQCPVQFGGAGGLVLAWISLRKGRTSSDRSIPD